MKVLITGASGYLGSSLCARMAEGNQLIGTYNNHYYIGLTHMDLSSSISVRQLISSFRPDLIIHSAALIDECETNPILAEAVNIKGTEYLASEAEKYNSKFVFISSAAVFDGKKGVFSELSPVSPGSKYGEMKSVGESIISSSRINHLILRPSLLVGLAPHMEHRFFGRSIERLLSNTSQEVDRNWQFTASWNTHIYEVITWWLSHPESMLLNVAAEGETNKLELLQLLATKLEIEGSTLKEKSNTVTVGRSKESGMHIIEVKEKEVDTPYNILEVEKLKEVGAPHYTLGEIVAGIASEVTLSNS